MAPQSKISTMFFNMLVFLFSALVFFSSLCNSRSLATHTHAASTSSNNFKQFEGHSKGHQGLLPIKAYLHRYGYLDSLDHLDHDQVFDDELESAILTYQKNFHLNTTGMLDSETLAVMMAPRCGCPDIINGTNTMAPRRPHATNSNSSSSFETSKYTFFNGEKWEKNDFNVVIGDTVPPEEADWVEKGLAEWQDKTKFSFTTQGADNPDVDIHIEKFSGDHGDGSPFDGPGGILAHGFGPGDGRIHFDGDEAWTDGAEQDMMDMTSVSVHELGHILGLGHTSDEDAIMYPTIGSNQVKRVLQQDDLDGIEALYPGIVR